MIDIEHIASFCAATGVPGVVAGISRGGEQTVVAHGVANIATGAPMRPDTGFLFGSITKIMTTTLVMRQVERGALDLDAPVAAHLPGFPPALLVRHLITHTSGIDADLFFPRRTGRGRRKPMSSASARSAACYSRRVTRSATRTAA